MTIHSLWTKEPGRLQSTGSQRVRQAKQLNNKNNKQEIMIIRIRSHSSLSTICYLTEVQEVRSGDTQPPPRRPFTESDSSLIRKGWVLTSGVLVPDFLPGHGDLTKGRIVA